MAWSVPGSDFIFWFTFHGVLDRQLVIPSALELDDDYDFISSIFNQMKE